jgi:hypothetical protein
MYSLNKSGGHVRGKKSHHLTAEQRKHLAKKNFAGPDRSYPIEDKAHARNALARVSQFGSPALKARVRAKVHAKYPDIGEAHGGKVYPHMGEELKAGGKVPGHPKVHHDSYKNDVVEAKLSPGEVVIDLDSLHHKGKLGKMARFVAKEIERKKMGRKLV